MIFTADQIVAHMVGDYILQSHWMATEKTKNHIAAWIHAICYTLPFLLITHSFKALWIIAFTHYLIDRYRLARFIVWLKNGPLTRVSRGERFCGPWSQRSPDRADMFCDECGALRGTPCFGSGSALGVRPLTATGYPDDVPAWLSVWLLIITDNTIHVICNGVAIWAFPA